MTRRSRDESPEVRCPYYKGERQSMIYCEGPLEGSCIHMAFGSGKGRRDYEKCFCMRKWQLCMVADAHNRIWDYEAR